MSPEQEADKHPILAAVEAFTDAAILADELIADRTDDSMDALAELAATLYDFDQIVQHVRSAVAQGILLVDLVGGKDDPYRIPSGGQLVRRGGGERKNYDQPRVVSAIAAHITEALGTGDDDDTPIGVLTNCGERLPVSVVVGPVVAKMAALTGAAAPSFNGWRVKEAESIGVKLADFHDWVTSDLTIAVEGRPTIARAGGAVIERIQA